MKGRIKRPNQEPKFSLPQIGKIKTGFKDARGFPKSTDYFIPVGKYASHFTKVYGDKPNVIQVVFLSDDPGEVCRERYEYRDKDGKLFAHGDGEIFNVWTGEKYEPFDIAEHPKIMEQVCTKYPNKSGWEIILSLRFLLPKVKGVAGYWEYNTKGSASTIPNITETFDTVLGNKSFVKGLIFDLVVTYAKSQKPGSKSRFPVVSLVPNMSETNMKLIGGNIVNVEPKQLEE